jgi:CotS family spore coat protein
MVEDAYLLKVEASAPVRSAWRLAARGETYFLKQVRTRRPELAFVAELYDYAGAAAPGLVPRLLRTVDGETYFRWRDGAYQLLTSFAGREAEYLHPSDLAAAANGLRAWHDAARGFSPGRLPGTRRWYGTWPRRLAKRMRDLDRHRSMAMEAKDRFGPAYLALWPAHRRQAESAPALLPRTEYQAVSKRAAEAREICHHDLAHHNILLEDGRIHFVDLDYALADSCLHDLVNMMGHAVRLHFWDLEPVRAITRSYWPDRRPPSSTVAILGVMMLWPQDFWQIGRQRYDERQPWSEDHFLDLLARKCGHVGERLKFLRNFWREYGLEMERPE